MYVRAIVCNTVAYTNNWWMWFGCLFMLCFGNILASSGEICFAFFKLCMQYASVRFTTTTEADVNSKTFNYENNKQDALYGLIYYSKSALHVLGDVFDHHQEHLTVFTVSGSVHTSCCRAASRQQLGWPLPDTVNTVKCSWWWAKTSPTTCRADLE